MDESQHKTTNRELTPLAARLGLPEAYEARMCGIVATSVGLIIGLRPDWYRARLRGSSHLRIFFGRLIVVTLEGGYVWLGLDENALGDRPEQFRSWCWDEPGTRPREAKGAAYPRYARPKSRNGFYDPTKDPEGTEWRSLEIAHHAFLRRVATSGRAPDHRTKSDPGLVDEIATWRPHGSADIVFELDVRRALQLQPEVRRQRLARAPRRPGTRLAMVLVFNRSADVVAEVLLRARGTCEGCGQSAPFLRASDGTPYLEVHHRVRLADGGDDTVENAVALCPNCHRKHHFG